MKNSRHVRNKTTVKRLVKFLQLEEIVHSIHADWFLKLKSLPLSVCLFLWREEINDREIMIFDTHVYYRQS